MTRGLIPWSGAILLLLHLGALAQDPQADVQEVRFHRVHLRNGNFIDGALVKQTESSVTLRLKSGDFTVRADLIDRIEVVKIRTINEKPSVIPPKSGPVSSDRRMPPPDLPRSEDFWRTRPQEGGPDPFVTSGFSKETVDRVTGLLDRFKKDTGETRFQVLQEISSLGAEGAVFVASNLGAFPDEGLAQLGAILSQMKVAETRAPATKALSHRNPQVRVQAVALLAELAVPASVNDLLPLLKDADILVRGQAIDALVRFGAREAVDPLAQFCSDSNLGLRSKALTALPQLLRKLDQEGEILPRLTRALEGSKGSARADLATALGKTARPEAWNPLALLLSDPDSKVRQAAATGLMNLQVPDSADSIVFRLPVEDDKWTRIALAHAAQRVNARKAVEILIPWMDDPDAEVRAAGHQALRTLTSQGLDQNRAKWDEWYSREGARFR